MNKSAVLQFQHLRHHLSFQVLDSLLLGHCSSNNLTTNSVRGRPSLSFSNHDKYLFIYRLLFDTHYSAVIMKSFYMWLQSSMAVTGAAEDVHKAGSGCCSELHRSLKMQQNRQTSTQSFAARCEWPVCSSSSTAGPRPAHQEEKRRESAFLKDTFICPLKTGQFV